MNIIRLLTSLFVLAFACSSFAANSITLEDAEQWFKEHIAQEDSTTDVELNAVRVASMDGRSIAALNDAKYKIRSSFLVKDLAVELAAKRFSAYLVPESQAERAPTLRIYGSYDRMVEIPVLSRMMREGEIIAASDITFTATPERLVRSNHIIKEKDMHGMRLTRMVRADRPLSSRDIMRPHVVEKGDVIPLRFKTKFINLKTLGSAMANAAEGDIIRVKNVDSDAVVQAMITAEGEAIVNYTNELILAQR